MKKIYAFLGITTLLVSSLVIAACGTVQSTMTDEKITEELRYRQYTPTNEIVKGNATAVQTINDFLNKDVIVGKDDPYPGMTSSFSYLENDVCMRYEVDNFNSDDRILYLYKDDTHITEAVPSDITYVEGDNVDISYRKNENYDGEIFAWIYDGKATAVLNKEAGPRCTSIWEYDESANEVRLIWADVFNCPIWVGYYD